MNEKQSIVDQVILQSSLLSLKSCQGWDILVEHVEKVKSAVVSRLLVEKDPTEIIRLQERHRAFSSVIDTVLTAEVLLEHLSQQLREINDEEEFAELTGS